MNKTPEKRVQAASGKNRAKICTENAIINGDYVAYETAIVHDWMRTLTTLAFSLVPLFFVLDIFIMPTNLLPRFAVYRFVSALIVLIQYFIVRNTPPTRWSYLHGYLISLQVGGVIALMTVDLGGFDSTYYAGLNLVIIGVNLLLPWRWTHAAVNSFGILAMYIGFNLVASHPFDYAKLTNNLFFLGATALIAVAINFVRHNLTRKEFSLLVEHRKARDALWSEMELAKRIQTALLPKEEGVRGFEIAVTMQTAREVGGDYYDIIETDSGERWVAIGDVSGHGVDAGLIMMMAQTSAMTVIKGNHANQPDDVLNTANAVIKENIRRLGSNHYMSMMVMKLEEDHLDVAGHHQDLLIYRSAQRKVTAVPTKGTWLGITDQIRSFTEVRKIDIADNDMVLLFTDGVTEAACESGEMFGQERLQEVFEKYASLPPKSALERILGEMQAFRVDQMDDMTLILVKKVPAVA